MIKLYGCGNGYGSRAQVTRGFRISLEWAKVPFEFCAVDRDNGDFERSGDGEPIAIMTGPLEMSDIVAQTHKRRFAMVAPNGTTIPKGMARMLKDVYTDIMVPSEWCREAVKNVGLPVHVVPHGVFEGFGESYRSREELFSLYDEGIFSVVHFSSSHGQRKGTLELVKAWSLLRESRADWEHASLVLVLDGRAQVRLLEEFDGPYDGITITSRLDGDYHGSGMSPLHMGNGMRVFHAVCQPSRGEAFGLVPLEAMAAGVPVLYSVASGHQQYCYTPSCRGAGSLLILPTNNLLAPLDDCEDSMAPVIDVAEIADGLRVMKEQWKAYEFAASVWRQSVLRDWDWRVHTGTLVKALAEGQI